MPVFADYDFNDTGTVAQDGAAANGAQNGVYLNGAAASGGAAVLDGKDDLVKIYADPAFQMSRGTLNIGFEQGSLPSAGATQTVLSRDSEGSTNGGFHIDVQADGSVRVVHEIAGSDPVTYTTAAGFVSAGDAVQLSYSWDQGAAGGQLVIHNATTAAEFTSAVPGSVTMDMGAEHQPWIVGAGQDASDPDRLNDIDNHFSGRVTQFTLSDTVDNTPGNVDPHALDDSAATAFNTPVTIAVLDNDSDPDGDPLTITGTPAADHGTVVINADGTMTFTPDDGFSGTATVTYQVSDGQGGHDSAVVSIFVGGDLGTGRDGIVSGTDGADLIDTGYAGDPDGDVVDGNDAILAGTTGNDDVIVAGAGNDTILSGLGDDTVFGGAGNDSIIAGPGDDMVFGGAGDDTVATGDGNDIVYGGDGADLIDTSAGQALPDQDYPGLYAADDNPFDDRDTVFGGAGDDTIRTGDDDDVVSGGAGNDWIDAGVDDDQIHGGTGQDTLIGGEGSDLIHGNDGDDLIYGDHAPGQDMTTEIADADGDLRPMNGRDSLKGDAGNDTIYGGDDRDELFGGTGHDLLYGGIDDDLLDGGAGNDTLSGGQGADTQFGGYDRDLFIEVSDGDVIDGGEGGDDFDTLDLTGAGPLRVEYVSDHPENGTIYFLDGDGNTTGTATFINIENVIPCFTPGTLIATPRGEVLVEDLREGDKIVTRDNGIQQIRWVGARTLGWPELNANPHLKPVLIKRGSLGNGLPERDMMVSPNHRMLVANDRTQLYFDEHEVLVSAKHLISAKGIQAVDSIGTTYLHFMFDRHEVVLANGAWTESFQPGDYTLKGMGNAQRAEIFEIFPELRQPEGRDSYSAARRTLKRHEAALLTR